MPCGTMNAHAPRRRTLGKPPNCSSDRCPARRSGLAHFFEVLADVGDVVVRLVALLLVAARGHEALGEPFQVREVVWAELVDDAGQELLQAFALPVARNDIGVRRNRSLDFRRGEVDHRAVLLEHVDLLNARNGIHPQALQLRLQLLVVGPVVLVLHDLGAPRGALAAGPHVLEASLQLVPRSLDVRGHGHGAGGGRVPDPRRARGEQQDRTSKEAASSNTA
mmetsp:Transcript_69032/g.135524  ORF Transcript_69032/g.135524 Transcript_69032/m.135524 type:complete len:222 (-) Transcript_69032:13-678(-)